MTALLRAPGYEIVRELGGGAMGSVYLAIKKRDAQQVAVKFISEQYISDASAMERFRREARALKLLKHPNIVGFVGFSGTKHPHIVMEFVDGESVAQRLRTEGPLSVPEAIGIATQTVAALAYAASRKIIHRDVKPSNVMLTGSAVKVTDFGLAKQIAVDKTLTAKGTILGTPRYMAPEQFEGKPATEQSDIYSLAILLFEMLAGYAPFQASDVVTLYQQHRGESLPVDELPAVPKRLLNLLVRIASKAPDQRPRYAELSAELAALSKDVPRGPRPALVAVGTTPLVPAETVQSRTRFAGLRGLCFCCDNPTNTFSQDRRFCEVTNCGSQNFLKRHPRDGDVYVTILPDRGQKYTDANLPALDEPSALLARARTDVVHHPAPQAGVTDLAEYLPYRTDHLAQLGLSLGNPILYKVTEARRWAAFKEVYVLDMSTYGWSHTLKDPKSWAVLNCAIESGATDLALYTAGNAGVSLAQMVYEVNKRHPSRRFQVHALADPKMTSQMRAVLAAWGCHVLDIDDDGSHILHPRNIWTRIFPHYTGEGTPPGAWHVTDGWDGVGIIMYRLLLAQVLRQLDVDYVVVPLGTGSLFLGTYLGINDSSGDRRPTLVGAVPAGENILSSCGVAAQDVMPQASTLRAMPKLAGHYTPLAPCIANLHEKDSVRFVPVTLSMLTGAAKAVLPVVAAEPSALAGFAALHGRDGTRGVLQMAQQREDPSFPTQRIFESQSSVLVVSSGLGLLSESEAELLSPPPRA